MAKADDHERVKEKFGSAQAAASYSKRRVGRRKDRLEMECIGRALAGVPRGSLVLDLPCGTGRITTYLVRLGYRVHAADYSEHMVDLARQACAAESGDDGRSLAESVSFSQQDVTKTTFADGEFDAVACNRLLHHYADPAQRREALRELSRICKGPIAVSFYRSLSLSALRLRLVSALRGVVPGRKPIPLAAFREDLTAVGLELESVHPVRYLISPQTVVKAIRRSAAR